MDLLMSLPIASYFFSTSLTSWSTSLNLLFFYMTWTTLILSHSPLKIELFGTTFLRLVFWLLPSLLFLLLDTLLPSLSSSIKHTSLPPTSPRTLLRILLLALLNLLISTALQALLSLSTSLSLHAPVFRASTTFPLPFQITKHILLLFLFREFLTYHIHRHLLHNPTRSPYLTSLHTSYAHRFPSSAPFSLLLMADHPLPFLLHRFLPLYLPALLMQRHLHLLTFFLFFLLATIEDTLSLSGYTIIPGIIMGGITRRNALHYCCPRGNYGCWGVLDWVYGTSLGRDVMLDVKEEAEKHRLRGKGEGVMGGVGGMVREGVEGLRRSQRTRERGRKSAVGREWE